MGAFLMVLILLVIVCCIAHVLLGALVYVVKGQ
jgi:hypothetical protein